MVERPVWINIGSSVARGTWWYKHHYIIRSSDQRVVDVCQNPFVFLVVRFRSRKSGPPMYSGAKRAIGCFFFLLIRICITCQKRVMHTSNENYVVVFYSNTGAAIVDKARRSPVEIWNEKWFRDSGKEHRTVDVCLSELSRRESAVHDSHIALCDLLPANSRGSVELFIVHWLFRFTSVFWRPCMHKWVHDLLRLPIHVPGKYRIFFKKKKHELNDVHTLDLNIWRCPTLMNCFAEMDASGRDIAALKNVCRRYNLRGSV